MAMAPAAAPAISRTTPPNRAAPLQPHAPAAACRAIRTPTPIANVTIIGITRQVSTVPRASFSEADGWKVRSTSAAVGLRRNRIGGLPSHDDPRLALRGVAESTATRPSSGTRRPGWVIPELPRNARLPMVAGPTWIQPPPSS